MWRTLLRVSKRIWLRFTNRRNKDRVDKRGLTKEQLKRTRYELVRDYKPEIYLGGVTIFMAIQDNKLEKKIRSKIWGKIIKGEIEIVNIHGDHDSIIQPPEVNRVADHILNKLAAYEEQDKAGS